MTFFAPDERGRRRGWANSTPLEGVILHQPAPELPMAAE
jgi:hypothetical protein